MLRRLFFCLTITSSLVGGEWPRELKAFKGATPVLDGVISPGEWADAVTFEGTKGWTPQFSPTTDDKDLSLKGYVKYDDHRLYFAFDVTDDILYGIDTDRWVVAKNPLAHELTQKGWPWFGDEIELLINATNHWEGDEEPHGDGQSWQMVCNLTKSRLGGVGVGGLMEGEPRIKDYAWNHYLAWIKSGAMQAVARRKAEGKGYIIEWSIAFDPCLEVSPGKFFQPADKEVVMGLNIAIGDLDTLPIGEGNFGNFHHEDWFAGEKNKRTQVKQWGSLRLMPVKATK